MNQATTPPMQDSKTNSPTPDDLPTSACRRLLVVRNDRLGDFMLAWPALALLRASLPETEITALVPPYTEPMAQVCPWLDGVIPDPGAKAPASEQRALLHELRRRDFEAQLTLFSTFRVGWLGLRAKIPLRLAPATKMAQFLYPLRITQRRSHSLKPEYVYNEELAQALLHRLGVAPRKIAPPFWPLTSAERTSEREKLATRLGLNPARPWFFVHTGSGGSANNLSLSQYELLVRTLQANPAPSDHSRPPCWVLTAGPGEEARTRELAHRLLAKGVEAVVYQSEGGIATFARSLAAADLFIAGSTGPLHVAGCLDLPTVGFFPGKRSSTALRWRPCNSPGRTLGIQPPPDGPQTNMERIDPEGAAAQITLFRQQLMNMQFQGAAGCTPPGPPGVMDAETR